VPKESYTEEATVQNNDDNVKKPTLGSLLPVIQSLLCAYVPYLAGQNLNHGTIKVYLSVVRKL